MIWSQGKEHQGHLNIQSYNDSITVDMLILAIVIAERHPYPSIRGENY